MKKIKLGRHEFKSIFIATFVMVVFTVIDTVFFGWGEEPLKVQVAKFVGQLIGYIMVIWGLTDILNEKYIRNMSYLLATQATSLLIFLSSTVVWILGSTQPGIPVYTIIGLIVVVGAVFMLVSLIATIIAIRLFDWLKK